MNMSTDSLMISSIYDQGLTKHETDVDDDHIEHDVHQCVPRTMCSLCEHQNLRHYLSK